MGKLKSFGDFALPDYPAQTDLDFKEDDWVVGDSPKGYEWDSSKGGDENILDMNKAVEVDRQSMVEDYGRGNQKGSANIRNKSYFDSSVGTGWMGAMKDYMHGHIMQREVEKAFPAITKKDLQSLLKSKEVKSNSQDWRVSGSVYKKKIQSMIKSLKEELDENRLKHKTSDWEGRAKISRNVRKNLFKKFGKKETTESKTIKVGEDAVGKLTSEIHYALVVDNKVIKTGTKEEMLKLHDETKGSRVWVTSSKEGAIVEEAPMNSTGPSISMPPTMKKKKKKDEDFLKRWESYGNKHDNGVHEQGTDETRKAYQEDTPGQDIDEYIEIQTKFFQEQKNKVQIYFSQVFGNPLEGYPANEEVEVK